MRIQKIRAIHGPNVVSHSPVLVMRLDLEDLAGKEGCDVLGFVDRLVAALPGICGHDCGVACFAPIVERVALELAGRAGISVDRAETISAGPPNFYDVYVEFQSEHGMKRLLEIAVDFVQSVIDERSYPLDARLAEVRDIIRDCDLGSSARAIVDAAGKRGIPWSRLGDDSLVQLGYGRRRKFIQAAMGSQT